MRYENTGQPLPVTLSPLSEPPCLPTPCHGEEPLRRSPRTYPENPTLWTFLPPVNVLLRDLMEQPAKIAENISAVDLTVDLKITLYEATHTRLLAPWLPDL